MRFWLKKKSQKYYIRIIENGCDIIWIQASHATFLTWALSRNGWNIGLIPLHNPCYVIAEKQKSRAPNLIGNYGFCSSYITLRDYQTAKCLCPQTTPQKNKKAVKEKNLQPAFGQASIMRISIFQGCLLLYAPYSALRVFLDQLPDFR